MFVVGEVPGAGTASVHRRHRCIRCIRCDPFMVYWQRQNCLSKAFCDVQVAGQGCLANNPAESPQSRPA